MKLSKLVKDAGTIGISGHVRPDGDCYGSTMAMYLYLKKICPDAKVILMLDSKKENMRDMKYLDEIDTDYGYQGKFDLFICCDCSSDRMNEEAQRMFNEAKLTINIDHHITNINGTGKENYVKPEVGSCAELVYELIKNDENALSYEERMDADIALALYIGIIHDTGVFQYSNTRPETLISGAELIKFGFDFPRIVEETFYQKTYAQNQIMGRALLESVRFFDNRCIVSCVDKKTMDFYEVTSADMDGIVNQLRNIKGIDCAIFMYELATTQYKVSLRTTPAVDAAEVVKVFGGGGHARAAGCTMDGNYHDCVNNLSQYIARQLEENA